MESKHKTYRLTELLVLFVLVPILLALPVVLWLKLAVVGLGVLYVLALSYYNKTLRINFSLRRASKFFWRRLGMLSIVLVLITTLIIQLEDPTLLFSVPKNKPLRWVIIVFIYAFLSVVPQEFLYRKFFYQRYQYLFTNKHFFFWLNVCCFSLCHLFLKNALVMLITFIGGILFAYTYQKEKHLFWVILEHSIYGNLIFSLGLGEMLAFPT